MVKSERAQAGGVRTWFGYADVQFAGPSGEGPVTLNYVGEPPHGDSLHTLEVEGKCLPGYFWGNGLAWSPCGRYILLDCSRSLSVPDRDVAVIDLEHQRLTRLPRYFHASRFVYPTVFGESDSGEAPVYVFSGDEEWSDAV